MNIKLDLLNIEGEDGRGDLQADWHNYFAENIADRYDLILDIGSGLGKIKERIPKITTSDNYPDCTDYVELYRSLKDFWYYTYNCVTMFDVIEHLKSDIESMERACQIATQAVFLTTPNFNISHCNNPYHYREYTPLQFFQLCHMFSDDVVFYTRDRSNVIKKWDNHLPFLSHNEPDQGALIHLCV